MGFSPVIGTNIQLSPVGFCILLTEAHTHDTSTMDTSLASTWRKETEAKAGGTEFEASLVYKASPGQSELVTQRTLTSLACTCTNITCVKTYTTHILKGLPSIIWICHNVTRCFLIITKFQLISLAVTLRYAVSVYVCYHPVLGERPLRQILHTSRFSCSPWTPS